MYVLTALLLLITFEEFHESLTADVMKQALTSNPKGPMDDHVAETTKKTVKNVAGDLTY
jgi:hypothetical protein